MPDVKAGFGERLRADLRAVGSLWMKAPVGHGSRYAHRRIVIGMRPLFVALVGAVVVTHFAFLVYLPGWFLALRRRRTIMIHVLAVAWAVGSVVLNFWCPLTALERWARARAGMALIESGRLHRPVCDGVFCPPGRPDTCRRRRCWPWSCPGSATPSAVVGPAPVRRRARSHRPGPLGGPRDPTGPMTFISVILGYGVSPRYG